MSVGSVRKLRAADRPSYFTILLCLRSGCFAHRSSQIQNRSSPIVTETPTKHCTSLALALKLVPSGCRHSMQLHCTKGAEFPVSTSRTNRTAPAAARTAARRSSSIIHLCSPNFCEFVRVRTWQLCQHLSSSEPSIYCCMTPGTILACRLTGFGGISPAFY